jgi:RNA polymerase sigma-70 factor (ECF subfamily)
MALTLSEVEARSVEADLIQRACRREEAAIRSIIQVHNRRLYRVARSIVRDDWEAEDVLQEAYFRAFSSLASFRGDSSLSTWLTRIVVNEALQRMRRHTDTPVAHIEPPPEPHADIIPFPLSGQHPVDPERAASQHEICRLLEKEIDRLPEEFRTVLVARIIEGLSIEETADLYGIRPETVKTRLHRARKLLKSSLEEHIGPFFSDVFPFDGKRCERLTNAVVARLARTDPGTFIA